MTSEKRSTVLQGFATNPNELGGYKPPFLTTGRATKRAGADGGRRELRHDGPGQRAAYRSRAPHEAARGPQRHCRGIQTLKKDLATSGAQGRAVERPGRGPQSAAPQDGARRVRERREATEFRVLQDNADKFQHNKDLTDRRVKAVDAGAFRAPTNAARSFNFSLRRLGGNSRSLFGFGVGNQRVGQTNQMSWQANRAKPCKKAITPGCTYMGL